ncbi:hypothetical protein JCM8547_007570 [Rhodosporidiobolus lusitaniae]
MDYHHAYSQPAHPRATSSFLAFKDAEAPPRPDGIPFPSAYDAFMNPITPFLFGVIYFAVAKTLSHFQNGKNRIKGRGWDVAVVAHNVFLAAYSAWTFVGTAPQIFGAFWRGWVSDGVAGLTHAFCDSQLSVWGSNTFPRYTYIFYLSKYYEIVDTAILLLKGKKVGMLQSYHHMGAVWTMFAGYRSQAMPIWLFCVFNSFIHTVMYCYYAVTSMKLPFPQFIKRNITRMQITQFLIGGSLAASYLFIKLPDLPSFATSVDQAAAQFHTAVDEAAASLHLAAGEAAASFSSAAGEAKASFQSAADAAAAQLQGAASSLESSMGTLRREGAQCLVNAAQRSAVWLNVAYLIPLTYLFAAFFVKTYRRGAAAKARAAQEKKAN